jgi:hypothetical protein
MKLPAFQFYPGDWRKDENLSRCSLAAKGALIEILCLAFQCEEKGKLITNGKPWLMDDICHAIGGDIKVTRASVKELLQKNVLKKDENGCIYSARMLRDESLRKVRREAGSKGGNPNLLNQKVNHTSNQTSNQSPTPSSSSSTSVEVERKKSKKESAVQFPLGFPVEKWQEWNQYRKDHFKKSYKSAISEQTAINHAMTLAGDDVTQIPAMINQSIARGWQGLFEVKGLQVVHVDNEEADRKRRAMA